MHPRQSEILELLAKEQRAGVRDLATRLSVSEMTIRRDLDRLEQEGLLLRTHGGAIAAGRLRFFDQALPHAPISPAKAAIGALAATLVSPGQTAMVDTGSTALEVARHLPRDADLTVATTSLCVAQELYASPIRVLLLGGFLHTGFPSLYGPLTESVLGTLHVDVLFIGCDGAHGEEGFFTADLHLASLEQAMIRSAGLVAVVTESVKFERRAFIRYAVPEQVHILITDSGLPDMHRRSLSERGVRVMIAETRPIS